MSGRQPARAGASRGARGAERPRVLRLARLDLRTDRSGSLSLAALVLVTTVLAGAAPILFARAADDALPTMMAAAEPVQRDLAFKLDGRLVGPISDPLAEVRAAGERLQAELPPSVAGLIDHGVVAADTPELSANELAGDGYTASLGFRAQPNIEERIRFIEGRAPAMTSPVTEIAVSAETLSSLKSGQAGWMGGSPLAVGDQLRLFPERGDSMLARIVGVFEPIDPTNDEWADRALLEPRIIVEGDGDRVDVHGTALIATDQVPAVAERFGGAFRYAWRFILDWRGADAETRATIATDLAALRVAYPFRGSTEGSEVPSLSTGLLAILERYFRELAATQAAMTLALIGPACAAAGALGMIAATIARRRHEGVMLVRARGATDRQVLVARLLVAVIIVVPAVAAAALGLILIAGTEWAAGVMAIASTIAILAVALAIASIRPAAARVRRAAAAEPPDRLVGRPPLARAGRADHRPRRRRRDLDRSARRGATDGRRGRHGWRRRRPPSTRSCCWCPCWWRWPARSSPGAPMCRLSEPGQPSRRRTLGSCPCTRCAAHRAAPARCRSRSSCSW